MQDEAIPFMDESCGYIEQVDDRTMFGCVSARNFRGDTNTSRRKDKEQNYNSIRRKKFRAYRRRKPLNKRSLLDNQDDEEVPSATNTDRSTNNSTIDCNVQLDEKRAKDLPKTGFIT